MVASAIEQLGLKPDELDHLARFLDVTKAALLFASGVILVEGLAEQLLVPLFADELGVSLAEASVTIVNVGGLAFGPFAALYEDGRLPHRCAIISDADPPSPVDGPASDSGDESESDSSSDSGAPESLETELSTNDAVLAPDPVLSATAEKLKSRENSRSRVFLSSKTFEHDVVAAGNWHWALKALALVKPRVAKRLAVAHEKSSSAARSDALLDAVVDVKGRFAQALTQTVGQYKAEGNVVVVPTYIEEAIRWACELGDSESASLPLDLVIAGSESTD